MYTSDAELAAKFRLYVDKRHRNTNVHAMIDHDLQIAAWESEAIDLYGDYDWKAIAADARGNLEPDNDNPGSLRGACYLGTVFSIMPSGKFYMPWACSNVTESEAERDEIYMEVLENFAAKYDLSIESGEGDPCDLFAVYYADDPNEDDENEES